MNRLPLMDNTKDDPTAETRKKDHIELALRSQVLSGELDHRFSYEPMLRGHATSGSLPKVPFGNKEMKVPIWVSSMTGGTAWAKTINHHLAKACGAFGMGMGLGSCRSLLFSDEHLSDFSVRHLMGDDVPLWANLGIAQVEQLLENGEAYRISTLLDKLQADGLIIHVNPLQEWTQPEGDFIQHPPIDTIRRLLDMDAFPLIVKEVGQGMGKASLKALMELPLTAIDFGASGGTNFAKIELFRNDPIAQEVFGPVVALGHDAPEMVQWTNELLQEMGETVACRQLIVSGGIRNFLDGYYHMEKSLLPAVYGQASGFLKHARGEYEALEQYVHYQVKGLEMAHALLSVR